MIMRHATPHSPPPMRMIVKHTCPSSLQAPWETPTSYMLHLACDMLLDPWGRPLGLTPYIVHLTSYSWGKPWAVSLWWSNL